MSRITIDGPPIRLEPKTAVMLAMALHELTTNATKYGALSGPVGRVCVRWSLSDDDRPRLNLLWVESDGPEVITPSARGFGSKLIERALATELRGTVELGFPPSGVTCEIDAVLPDMARLIDEQD